MFAGNRTKTNSSHTTLPPSIGDFLLMYGKNEVVGYFVSLQDAEGYRDFSLPALYEREKLLIFKKVT